MTRVRLFAAAAEAAGVDSVTLGVDAQARGVDARAVGVDAGVVPHAGVDAGGVDAQAVGDPKAGTLGWLRRELIDRYGAEFERVLSRCAVLVDGARLSDADPVPTDATVDILPPFAGG